jgi:hypothetical protein
MTDREHDPGDAWADALLSERTAPRPAPARAREAAPARTGRTWAMTVCVLSLLLGTPIAVQAAGEGDPVEGGARNPGTNETLALERETEIIAETAVDTYGTRQSNKGAGGGAIYGCRSTLDLQNIGDPAQSTPCIRANNLNDGRAFDLQVPTATWAESSRRPTTSGRRSPTPSRSSPTWAASRSVSTPTAWTICTRSRSSPRP